MQEKRGCLGDDHLSGKENCIKNYVQLPLSIIRIFQILLLQVFLFAVPPPAEALIEIPKLTGFVVDQTGILGGSLATINEELLQLKKSNGVEMAVLVVPTTDPESIEQFSMRVAERWKLGRQGIDDGLLLVVATNDRAVRLEVGRGLEGAITDVMTARIIREVLAPKFAEQRYFDGISLTIDILGKIIKGEKLPPPVNHDLNDYDSQKNGVISAIVVSFIVGALLAELLGTLIGATISSLIAFLIMLGTLSILPAAAVGVVSWFLILFRTPILWMLWNGRSGMGYHRYGGDRGGGGSLGSGGTFSGGGASGRW